MLRTRNVFSHAKHDEEALCYGYWDIDTSDKRRAIPNHHLGAAVFWRLSTYIGT